MTNPTIVERLRRYYQESCSDVSQTTDLEPRIQCNYCGHEDVGDSHYADCVAVTAMEAADLIEALWECVARVEELIKEASSSP